MCSINVLQYCVDGGVINPDPERLCPLKELLPLENLKSLKRALGMFAYYAKWIEEFSNRIQPLIETKTLEEGTPNFQSIKRTRRGCTSRWKLTFQGWVQHVAILNQGGCPVPYMSKTLQGCELKFHIVEKEVTAIIEAVCKWNHYISWQHFTLVTDQIGGLHV